jgi:hypothetical protein
MPNRAERHLRMLSTAAALLREYEAGDKTHAELAKERGVTRARVSQYIGIARLSRDLAAVRISDAAHRYDIGPAGIIEQEARASIALDGETYCAEPEDL